VKWFPRDFIENDDPMAVYVDYREHVKSFTREGGESLKEFVEILNLHDALADSLTVDSDGTLDATFLYGDLQVGYYYLDLKLTKTRISMELDDDVSRLQRGVEILYEELDRIGDEYELRLLLDERGEIAIAFSSIQWGRRPASGEDRKRIMRRRRH
jgi:hypothetical protein